MERSNYNKMEMGIEMKKIIKVCVSAISSICYAISFLQESQKALTSFSLLLIFYLFFILPYSLSSSCAIVHCIFLFTRLDNFKLLLFAFDVGTLSMDPPKKSLLLFITIATLPIIITTTPKTNDALPLKLPTQIFLLSVLVFQLGYREESSNVIIFLSFYCLVVFVIVDVSIGIWIELVRLVSGLDLLPPSDEPYLSNSLQDFWGRRWNLRVTNILQGIVHNPLRLALGPTFGAERAKVVAILATFMVSSLMHELYLYNLMHASPKWEKTLFFLIQGVGLVVELWVKKVLGCRWALSAFISTPLTMGFMVVTSYWFFFPPLLKNGVDVMLYEESMDFTKNKCMEFYVTF